METEYLEEVEPCTSYNKGSQNILECPTPAKKKKTDVNGELIELAKERNEIQKQIHQERKDQISELINRLDVISSQNAAFQTELLSILRNK